MESRLINPRTPRSASAPSVRWGHPCCDQTLEKRFLVTVLPLSIARQLVQRKQISKLTNFVDPQVLFDI